MTFGRQTGRWVWIRWQAAILAACTLATGIPTFADGPRDADEGSRGVASLSGRIEELAPGNDILDSLHFGWFDRPYARATLATLRKVSSALQRETRLRNARNAAIPDRTLGEMMLWAEDALDRVLVAEPDRGFRPHRSCYAVDAILGGNAPPLFAFLDAATATRGHATFGDLDLLASLGQRVYARAAGELPDALNLQTLFRRADYLGMAVALVELGSTIQNSESAGQELPGNWFRIRPLTLAELLSGPGRLPEGVEAAVSDPPAGEPWPSRLARRALHRGVMAGKRGIVCGWNANALASSTDVESSTVAAAVWVDALDGTALSIASGWRDLRDGSGSPFPSLFTRPADIESFARAAFDVLRFRDALPLLGTPRSVVILVPPDAVDPTDANRWAEWITPLFSMLFERQIPFDVAPAMVDRRLLEVRYSLVFPVRREDATDWDATFSRFDAEHSKREGVSRRTTIRELDGSFPRGLYVRVFDSEVQRRAVAIVNLSPTSRVLTLSGDHSPGRLHDALSHTQVGRNGRFTLGPWEASLLVAP